MGVLEVRFGPNDRDGRREWTTHVDRRCRRCGYGVAVRVAPGRCPMCGGRRWVEARPGFVATL